MARQTRQQRRARREKQAEAAAAPARRQQVRPTPAEAPPSQTGVRGAAGAGGRRFVFEAWAELRKVEWPDQRQVMQGSVVVLIACTIVGAYLWGADLLLKRLVQNVFLGQ